jgi:hypothetical protein
LRALGFEDGNGFSATIIPGGVKSAAEDGSLESNGPEKKLRISLKG